MSSASPLVDLLRRARAALTEAPGAARRLTGRGSTGRFKAVLAEIDETMLPRALTFRLGDASAMTLEVRARRAVRVTELAPESDDSAAHLARLEDAGAPREERLAAMAALIAGFAKGSGVLSVTSQPSTLPPSVVDKGFAPAELTGAVPSDEQDPAAEQMLPDESPNAESPDAQGDASPALAAAVPESGAALTADFTGRVQSESGDWGSVSTERLARALAAASALNAPFLDRAVPGARLLVFSPGAEGGKTLCLGADTAGIAVAAVAQEALQGIADAWRGTRSSRE